MKADAITSSNLVAAHVQQVWHLLGVLAAECRVAVFGAGDHTRWLYSIVARTTGGPKVVAVLDDSPEDKPCYWGCRPIKPDVWEHSLSDIVVISSDTAGDQIKRRCLDLFGRNICVIDLYEGFPAGPYPKNCDGEELSRLLPDGISAALLKKVDAFSWSLQKLENQIKRQTAEQYRTYARTRDSQFLADESRFMGFTRDMWDVRDVHKGRRCFIIGNGPSLNQVDMTLLKNEITYGSNRVYLGFPKWGFSCTYWCIQDETQIVQDANKYLKELPENITKFIPLQFIEYFDPRRLQNVVPFNFVDTPNPYPQFSASPSVIYNGWTVTYSLIQMAIIMGCNPIYLIGIDHKYHVGTAEIKSPNRWTDSESKSHFHPDYCDAKNNRMWNVPDISRMEAAYQLAIKEGIRMGISILNATPGSALTCIPKVSYNEIFPAEL